MQWIKTVDGEGNILSAAASAKLVEKFASIEDTYKECVAYFTDRINCCGDLHTPNVRKLLIDIALLVFGGNKV